MYKLIGINSVQRLADGACIPFADGNRDYEEYKQWLEEGNTPEPEFSEEELAQKESQKIESEFKAAKKLALESIVVAVGDKEFDGNETARLNMISAIQASDIVGISSNLWKLADNSVQEVSAEELKEALAKSTQEVGRIVMCSTVEEILNKGE